MGQAEDKGKVLSIDAKASVPFGSYSGVLQTEDTNPLEPNALEHKFYARGVGPVQTLDVRSQGHEELISYSSGR